ncbi:MAG: HAMP domain-containing sensor histidine kinase [Patescibacteria group bacterium]
MKLFGGKKIDFLLNNFQFVYGIILLVLVPAALVINTVIFIKNTENVMDVELQRKASLANGLFSMDLSEILDKPTLLQNKVESTVARNEEIYSLDVLVPLDEDFKIIASLDKEAIGKVSKYIYNSLAWRTGEAIAYSTTSKALSTEDQTQRSNERFWVVAKPILNSQNEKVGIASVKMSSRVIDDLAAQNVNRSLIILVATIVIIVLLLANNTRLFHYAVLFRKLKEVDEMKDEFISMTSHELRAPITGIRGYVQMILDKAFGDLPKEAEEKLRIVLKQSNNLNDLIGDLLDVSRIEQGRIKLTLQALVPSIIIENVVKSFEHEADKKELLLKASIESDLPQIYADEGKFRQVLVNLVSNAIKYTVRGQIIISAEVSHARERCIKIKVTDTGIGMSAKDRERLFEKFYRVKSVQTDKISGTGLGLWITRELVKMMNGEIYVDSIEGTGTEVTVLLPIYERSQ